MVADLSAFPAISRDASKECYEFSAKDSYEKILLLLPRGAILSTLSMNSLRDRGDTSTSALTLRN